MRLLFHLPTGHHGAPMLYPFAHWSHLILYHYPDRVLLGSTTAFLSSSAAIVAVELAGVQPALAFVISAIGIACASVITAVYGGRQAAEKIRSEAASRALDLEMKAREAEADRRERMADSERKSREAEASRRERMHHFADELHVQKLTLAAQVREIAELRETSDRKTREAKDLRAQLDRLERLAAENRDSANDSRRRLEALSDSGAFPALRPEDLAGPGPEPAD